MIDFSKHSLFLPFVAYKLNIYPAAFDVEDFIDIEIEYSEYCHNFKINFYYTSLKCRAYFVYRNDFYEECKKDNKLCFTLKSTDVSFNVFMEETFYSCRWRHLPKLTYFWKDYINESFFERICNQHIGKLTKEKRGLTEQVSPLYCFIYFP